MNIYIPIEIKVRELEGRTLLALAAAERGHTVVLGEKSDTIGMATKGIFPPGVVHMKSITPHESMLNTLRRLKKHNHAITVQDEESGLLDETYDTFARLRFSEKTIPSVDRVCTWGHYDESSLKKMYPGLAQKFTVTGSPRVDFWRKDFAGYYSDASDALTLEGKPYMMIVSNFGGPLNENRFWNIMARLNEAGYFEREEGRERHEFENTAYQTRLIGEFVFMIRELAKTYPDYHILVRPHPVESIEGWEKLIGNVPGVYINRNGTISRWIRHAKVIIHNGCTSALEAAIGDENRIAYRPIPHEIEREIPNRVSINAFSLEELKENVDGFLHDVPLHKQDPNSKEISDLLNNRFAAISGTLAADRIVDVWDDIANERNLTTSVPQEISVLKNEKKPTLTKKIKRSLVLARNSITGISKTESGDKRLLISSFKFPEFTTTEFESIKQKLEQNLGRFKDVTHKRFGEKSFLLYKQN
jgi:surface carbohydrate biosynthesis protein